MRTDIILLKDNIDVEGENVFLKDASGKARLKFHVTSGAAVLGGEGTDGDLLLENGQRTRTVQIHGGVSGQGPDAKIHINGDSAELNVGGGGSDGTVNIKSASGSTGVNISGQHGNITLGGKNSDGDLMLINERRESRWLYDHRLNGYRTRPRHGVC